MKKMLIKKLKNYFFKINREEKFKFYKIFYKDLKFLTANYKNYNHFK